MGGHYAQVQERSGNYYLLRGKDKNKDQSYFLSRIGQQALSRTMFPIGHLEKEVRKLSRKIIYILLRRKTQQVYVL